MLNKKIFILINSDREFDYYNSLIKKFPKHYVVVLNDHKKQVNYHSFKTLKLKKYLKVTDFLKSRPEKKLPILLSTGLGHLNIISIKSILIYLYARTFGFIMLKLNIHKYLFKIFKRTFTAGGSSAKIYDLIQIEKKISKISVCFPRGLDIDIKKHPVNRWVDNFDYFLVHSKYDKKIIEKNTKKPTQIIGYPRYIRKKNSKINTKIKKILWMPSYPKFSKDKLFNVTGWLTAFSILKKKYSITIKFHPKFSVDKKIKAIFEKHISIINNPKENLSQLYDKNDIIVCDYGGSIFSAVYNEKPVILLNNDKRKYGLLEENLEIVLRSKFYSINRFNNDKLINLINNISSDYKNKKLEIKKLKKKIFGNQITIGQVHKTIVNILN
jgi:hypothetical protein